MVVSNCVHLLNDTMFTKTYIDSRIGEVLLLKWKPEIEVDKNTVVVTTHNGEVGGTHSVQFSLVDYSIRVSPLTM